MLVNLSQDFPNIIPNQPEIESLLKSGIQDITEDSRGFLYLATPTSVLEFDNYSWRHINVSADDTSSDQNIIIEANDHGRIYLAKKQDFGWLVPNEKGELYFESFLHLLENNSFPIDPQFHQIVFQKDIVHFAGDRLIYSVSSGKISTSDTTNEKEPNKTSTRTPF